MSAPIERLEALEAERRRHESLRLDLELRQARFDAGAALSVGDTSPPPGPWPPPLPDPCPQVRDRLPVIDSTDADVAAVGGGVVRHGAVVVEGLLGERDVARIRDGMERAYAARAAVEAARTAGHDPAEEDQAWYRPFRPTRSTAGQKGKPHLIRLVDSPRLLTDVLDTYRRLGVRDLVADYLEEPPVFTANKTVLRYLEVPDTILPSDFHQDGRFMGDDIRALNVWVTLTDCGEDAPTLDVLPRREPRIHPTGRGDNGFDWTLSARQVEEIADGTPITRLHLRAGDAVVFDERLVHRSAFARDMSSMRLAIESWFYAPSTVPEAYQPLAA
jgi:hypothetical protein